MKRARALVALLVSALLIAGIGFGSRAAYSPNNEHDALLRLSWRMHMKNLHDCRKRTEAELAALPAHMRAPEVCTTRHIEYRLMVRIDGTAADTIRVAPSGAKGDRPLFVLHDVPLEPGLHQVRVEFAPTERAMNAPVITYSGVLIARAGRITLLTLSPTGSELVAVGMTQG